LILFLTFFLSGPYALTLKKEASLPQQQKEQIPKPAYEVEVVVTNVDVVVTDKKGNRITGLKPENFEIYEDGFLQKMTNFFEVKGMEVYTATYDEKEKELRVPPEPLPEKPPQPGNKIIFYFDNWHLHPLNRNWSIKKLESFIQNNFSSDESNNQGMIICLGQKLEVIQEFTSSQEQLLRALEDVKRYSGQSLLRSRTKEDLRKELNRIVADTSYDNRDSRFASYENALSLARNYVEAEQIDLSYSLKSIHAFLDFLIGIEGKKILIYISDGLPINPSEEVFSFLDQAFHRESTRMETLTYDSSRQFKELTARCNGNEITLYPINAQGLDSMILSADKEAGWDIYSRGSGMVKSGSRTKNEALQLMARDTGGVAILNTNDIESGLEKIEGDLQYYYSLGYVSPHREDGAYHTIEVKLVDVEEKYDVRLRHGYMRVSQEERIKESVTSRLFLMRSSNPMNIMVQILPVKPMPATNKLYLALKILIPIKNITLFYRENDYIGEIKVYIALMDSEGRLSPGHELTEQIKIPAEDYDIAMKSSYPYTAEMYVDPGHYIVSLAIKDVPSAVINYLQLEKTIQ